jgi:hypothetical protein
MEMSMQLAPHGSSRKSAIGGHSAGEGTVFIATDQERVDAQRRIEELVGRQKTPAEEAEFYQLIAALNAYRMRCLIQSTAEAPLDPRKSA